MGIMKEAEELSDDVFREAVDTSSMFNITSAYSITKLGRVMI